MRVLNFFEEKFQKGSKKNELAKKLRKKEFDFSFFLELSEKVSFCQNFSEKILLSKNVNLSKKFANFDVKKFPNDS